MIPGSRHYKPIIFTPSHSSFSHDLQTFLNHLVRDVSLGENESTVVMLTLAGVHEACSTQSFYGVRIIRS